MMKHSPYRGLAYSTARIPCSMLVFMLAITGCSLDMNIQLGNRPNVAAIEQRLRVGESKSDDVLAVLGPPRGKGFAVLPIDPKQRVTWSYMYIESTVRSDDEKASDMRSLILFIFLEEDRYAGYMWFSSLPGQTSAILPIKQ